LLHWKLEHCCLPNYLIIVSFSASIWICGSFKRYCTFSEKRVQGANLHASHRINPTSSNVVTSNWVKSIPIHTSHVVGTIDLSTHCFLPIPPTQRIKSYAQNQ
jgi:hypothetical protein